MESNVTLEAKTILSVLNNVAGFNVPDSSNVQTVTLKSSELVAGIVLEHFLLSLVIIITGYTK